MFTKEEITLAKPVIKAIKKISKGKWEWKPEVGEWWFDERKDHGRNPILISLPSDIEWINTYPTICIPLLHWEKIEEILEEMGYKTWTTKYYWEDTIKTLYECQISLGLRSEAIVDEEATTAREAVMQAVIELAKGIQP